MKKARNVVLALLCALLLIVGSVAGTLAYLTDKSDDVVNTFTVGKVEITLDEAKVDAYGIAIEGAARVLANEYKLIPGHEYTKDPTIHIKEGSEACYLFIVVNNGIADIEAAGENGTIADQILANQWTLVEGETNVYYKEIPVVAPAGGLNECLFTGFTILEDLTYDELSAYASNSVTITAYAVQNDGITVDVAWAAVNPANP